MRLTRHWYMQAMEYYLPCVFAILLLCGAPSCIAATAWVATATDVAQVDVQTGTTTIQFPVANVRQLAGTTNGGVWALTPTKLFFFTGAAQRPAIADVEALGYGDAILLATDPYDHGVWIATDSNLLVHFAADGRLQGGYMLPGRASAMSIALDQTVWVASNGVVWHVSSQPGLLTTIPMGSEWNEPISSIALDSLVDRIWIIGNNSIARLASNESMQRAAIARMDGVIRGSALDPKTGTLWLLNDTDLRAYDGDTRQILSISLSEVGADDASSLSYDGANDALVVSSPTGLWVLDRQGEFVAMLTPVTLYTFGAPSPFHLLPGISLVRPPQDGTTAERQPSFVLQLESLCNGIRCAIRNDYLESLGLIASLNGESIADQFRLDAITGQSTFVPRGPMAFGDNLLSAEVVDRFGHRSNTIASRLTVVDGANFRITPKANQAPAVSLTAPANNAIFVPGSTITLTATASDADGTITKVEFFRGGSTLIGTATTAPYSVIWANVPAGSYSLTAKATDNSNGTKTSSGVNIKVVAPPNVAPTVSITSPVGGSVVNGPDVIIAAAANDSDGTVTKVDFYDGSTLLGTFTAGIGTVNATWIYKNISAGAHTLKATATDNSGATASATVTVTTNVAPYVVLTSPANCSVIISPANMTLTADALDTDGSIARVDFYQGNTLLGTAARLPYTVTWSNVALGSYSFTAVATDNLGARRTSNPITISVLPPDVPPTVSLTAPSNGSTFGVNASIAVNANASDSDGTIAKVEFFVGATMIGTKTASPYAVTWTPTATGNYTLTAKATDNRGVAVTSNAVNVAVVTNKPPTVTLTAPASGASYIGPATVNLAANATDSDGTVAKVEFFANSILVGTATAAPYAATWTNVAGGSYSVAAKATDNLGATATSSAVSVLVDAPPRVYHSSPPDNTSYAAPASFILIGYAFEPDSSLVRMELIANGNSRGNCSNLPTTPGHDYSCASFWSGVQAGLYTFSWRATDSQGATAESAPVHITVNSVPNITLTTPANGSAFAMPATISLAANATQQFGAIKKVEFYAGTTLVGTAINSPYTATWNNVSPGNYSLTAKVIDNLGTTATSIPIVISVSPIVLTITSPFDGDGTFDATVVVAGTISGATPTSVTVNGYTALLTSSGYAATVPLQPGNNTLVVTANTSNGSASRSVSVIRNAPTLVVLNPIPGQAISDDNVTIRGVVNAPANSAIFVNNKLATIDNGNGLFFVNNLPLTAGNNTLTIRLNTPDGEGPPQTFSLTSIGVAPFTVDVTPDTVITAPAQVTLTLKNRGLASYSRVNLDLTGDGTDDFTEEGPATPEPQAQYTLTYPYPGVYSLRLNLLDATGRVRYTATRMIHVIDAASYYGRLTTLYTGMLNRLRAGDTEGALRAVTGGTYERYRDIFASLGSNLPAVIDRIGTITQITFGLNIAEVMVTRETTEGPQAFMIYLLRAEDGIWRIDGM